MPKESDLEDAIEVVCEFCREMNDWEDRMYYRSRIENDQYVPESKAEALAGTTYEGVRNEYYDIFARHCTERSRTYGGSPHGWSKGGSYAGVDRATIEAGDITQPGRIEVIATGGLFPGQRFKFILLKKGGAWRIDHALSQVGSDREWDRHHL